MMNNIVHKLIKMSRIWRQDSALTIDFQST